MFVVFVSFYILKSVAVDFFHSKYLCLCLILYPQFCIFLLKWDPLECISFESHTNWICPCLEHCFTWTCPSKWITQCMIIVYDIRDYVGILTINTDDDDGARVGHGEYDSGDSNEWLFLSFTDQAKSITTLCRFFWHIKDCFLFAQNCTYCNLNLLHFDLSSLHNENLWSAFTVYFLMWLRSMITIFYQPKIRARSFSLVYTFRALYHVVFQALWKCLVNLYLLICFKNCPYYRKCVRIEYIFWVHTSHTYKSTWKL